MLTFCKLQPRQRVVSTRMHLYPPVLETLTWQPSVHPLLTASVLGGREGGGGGGGGWVGGYESVVTDVNYRVVRNEQLR